LAAVIFPIASSDVPLVVATGGLAAVTLALALAAFWTALLTGRQMKRNYLPIMIPGRPDGIAREVTFVKGGKHVRLESAETYTNDDEDYVYLAFLLRNIGSGVAILNAVDARPKPEDLVEIVSDRLPSLKGLVRASRAVYLGPGEAGYVMLWTYRELGTPGRDAWGLLEETIPAKSDFLLD